MDNEELLKIILERFDKIDRQFDKVDNQFIKVDGQFKEVLQRLDKIEKSQQEDVKGPLNLISRKVDGIMYDVDYLSEKTGKHDTKLNLS
ncbi:hypothetical protein [Lentibacillus sp. Marseille-P4043]|uniref:hypothetical protein n=1 Tax=Lentibacillus sp. Marseille-P4043 TaxID=2040293 RepID=UPI000D0BE9EB|nr:hypothetical protein [Lentibacillus sp. Marseille-P4043]